MTISLMILYQTLQLFAGFGSGAWQNNQYASWTFSPYFVSRNEAIIMARVSLAPGWHIYSQHLKEGGPLPTHFSYRSDPAFSLEGTVEEKGNAVKVFDDNYEMEVAWYEGEVKFFQNIRLLQPSAIVKGNVTYMVCNDHICESRTRDFSVEIKSRGKLP